jgi:hypothetical protein
MALETVPIEEGLRIENGLWSFLRADNRLSEPGQAADQSEYKPAKCEKHIPIKSLGVMGFLQKQLSCPNELQSSI